MLPHLFLVPSKAGPICWDSLLPKLSRQMPSMQFDAWIRPLRLDAMTENRIVLTAPNAFCAAWVRDHWLSLIDEVLRRTYRVPAEFLIEII